jgi:hypothetical protein
MSARRLSTERRMTLASFGGPAAMAALAATEGADPPSEVRAAGVTGAAATDAAGDGLDDLGTASLAPFTPAEAARCTGGASFEHAEERSAPAASASHFADRITTRW